MNQVDTLSFLTIGSINKWAEGVSVQFLDGDRDFPYVQKGDLYHYFTRIKSKLWDNAYVLVMTSTRDIGEK